MRAEPGAAARAVVIARTVGVLALAASVLGACASEPPLVPPSELGPFDSRVEIERGWSVRLDDAGRGRFEPLVTDEAVYAAAADGEVARFDRADGAREWRVDLDARLASGVGGDDELVIVATGDGGIVALDAADGTEAWRGRATSEVLAPARSGFGTLVVRSADGRLASLDPATGAERWSASWTPPALTLNGYSAPRVLDGGLLVGLDDGRLVALDSRNGRPIWETPLSLPGGRSEVERLVDVDADVRVDDEGIYAVNYRGRAVRLEPARGRPVWSVPMSSTAGLELGPATVVAVDDESVVHGLDKATGRTAWTQDALRGRKLSPPAVVGGLVLVGDFEGYVHALALDDGSLAGRARPADAPIRARPVGDAGGLVVQAGDGTLASLRLPGAGGSDAARR